MLHNLKWYSASTKNTDILFTKQLGQKNKGIHPAWSFPPQETSAFGSIKLLSSYDNQIQHESGKDTSRRP